MSTPWLPCRSQSYEAPFIEINYEHNRDYAMVEQALKTLKSKPIGQSLLTSLHYVTNGEKKLTIVASDKVLNGTSTYLTRSQLQKYVLPNDPENGRYQNAVDFLGTVDRHGTPSEGTPAIVTFNPHESLNIDDQGYPIEFPHPNYNFANLAHELIHALHSMNGTALNRGCKPEDVFIKGTGQRKEEERAVGINEFKREAISENTIRYEHGLRQRRTYFFKDRPPLS